jgi:hypothetical protein
MNALGQTRSVLAICFGATFFVHASCTQQASHERTALPDNRRNTMTHYKAEKEQRSRNESSNNRFQDKRVNNSRSEPLAQSRQRPSGWNQSAKSTTGSPTLNGGDSQFRDKNKRGATNTAKGSSNSMGDGRSAQASIGGMASADSRDALPDANSGYAVSSKNSLPKNAGEHKSERGTSIDATDESNFSNAESSNAESTSNRGQRSNGSVNSQQLNPVPVRPPREVEISETGAPQIAYPEAPVAPTVSSAQIDALQLPANDPRRPVVGIWEQISGGNSADFAEGKYSRTVLLFRTDGILEIVRWYGQQHEVRVDSKLSYTMISGGRIRLNSKGGTGSTKPYSIPLGNGRSSTVQPAKVQFPVELKFSQNGDQLVLADKVYQKTKN